MIELLFALYIFITPALNTVSTFYDEAILGHRYYWKEEEIKVIYNRLLSHNYVPHLPLVFVHASIVNAATDGEQIIVYEGIMNKRGPVSWHNEDEVALSLGHELGHSAPDVRNLPVETNELGADRKAIEYMENAGYDVCNGAKRFLRTGEGGWTRYRIGNGVVWSYHPPGKERYKVADCG